MFETGLAEGGNGLSRAQLGLNRQSTPLDVASRTGRQVGPAQRFHDDLASATLMDRVASSAAGSPDPIPPPPGYPPPPAPGAGGVRSGVGQVNAYQLAAD